MWAHREGTDLLHLPQCFWNPSVLLTINGLIAGLSNKHHRHITKHFQKKVETANLPLVSDMMKQLLWTLQPKCGLWFCTSREWTLRSKSLYSLLSWRWKYTTTITSHFIKTTTQLYKDDAESELTSWFIVWMMNCSETGSSFFEKLNQVSSSVLITTLRQPTLDCHSFWLHSNYWAPIAPQ